MDVLFALASFLRTHYTAILVVSLSLNLVAFLLYGIDKYKAKKQLWRIPESTLLLFSFVGGGLGSLLGMMCFRHKTKHIKFRIIVPLFFLFYTIFFAFLLLLSSSFVYDLFVI